jgi:hypothetical protein
MSAFVASLATYTVLLTLTAACVGHVRRPPALRAALAAHGLVPAPALAAVTVTVLEGTLGAVLVVAVAGGSAALLAGGLAGAAALFSIYGGYGCYVVARGRAGPCGCGRVEVPMSGWVVGRTFALAVLAVTGLALAGSVVPLTGHGSQLAVALLAAATFGTLLGHLPAAMHHAGAGQGTGREAGQRAAQGAGR